MVVQFNINKPKPKTSKFDAKKLSQVRIFAHGTKERSVQEVTGMSALCTAGDWEVLGCPWWYLVNGL